MGSRERGQAAVAGQGDQAVDDEVAQLVHASAQRSSGLGGWAGQSADADAEAAEEEEGEEGKDGGEEGGGKRYKCSFCGQVKKGHSCVLGRRNKDDYFFPNAAPAPHFPGTAPPAGAVMRLHLIRGIRNRIARRLAEIEGPAAWNASQRPFDPAAWNAAQQMAAFQGNRLDMVQSSQFPGGQMVPNGQFYAQAAMGMHGMHGIPPGFSQQ